MARIRAAGAVAAILVACGPGTPDADPSTTGTGVHTSTETSASTTFASTSATAEDADGSASSAATTSTTHATSSGGGSTTDGGCDAVPDCAGHPADCSDALDNDGDGLVDLDDPECISPCDADEGSYCMCIVGGATDLYDCRMDCAYDESWGAGDDECYARIDCDPLDPAIEAGCEYTRSPVCAMGPMTPPTCVEFCSPRTPNGCDCFGCCTFATAQGPRNFFIEDETCTLADDLAGCRECTQYLELCGNPCDLNACERCIGSDGPPPGCVEVGCADAPRCDTHCDCADAEFCLLGCCAPALP
jgi:hypothetical protein